MSDAPAVRGRVRAGALGDPWAERTSLIAETAIMQGMTVVTGNLVDFNALERTLSIPAPENDGSRSAPHARLRRCRNGAIREWTGMAGHVDMSGHTGSGIAPNPVTI